MKPSIQRALAAGNVQEVIDNLTVKQRRFVEEYLIDFNGAAAVLRAGYNCKYPNRLASQMLNHPGIKAAIDQVTLERASDSVIKPDYVINKITRTIEKADAENNHSAVLRGCELLARHLGMFIERQEISGPNGDAIKIKQVQDAADAFTSAIAGLIERGGEGGHSIRVEPRT
jgi:phage terminase small subunit